MSKIAIHLLTSDQLNTKLITPGASFIAALCVTSSHGQMLSDIENLQ